MATTITRYINTTAASGGNGTTSEITGENRAFSSLAIAETTMATDLVARDIILEFICAGSNADNNCTINGYVTGATNYIIIRGAENISSIWDDNKYHISSINITGLYISINYIKISNLQVEVSSSTSALSSIRIESISNTNEININNCFIRTSTNSNYYNIGVWASDADVNLKIWNCIIIHRGGTSSSDEIIVSLGSSLYLGNITAVGGNRGVKYGNTNVGSTCYIRNCLITNTNTNDFYGATGPTYDWDYNASQDITAYSKGTNNNRINQTFTFTDATNFALSKYDTGAKFYGTSMEADPYIPYNYDITGNSVYGTWDIGAIHDTEPRWLKRYVNTLSTGTGGDGTTNLTLGSNRAFATLSRAETAMQRNLVTSNEVIEIECCGTTADTNCSIGGYVTGATNYITIYGAENIGSIWDDNKYRISVSTNIALEITDNHIRVSNLQIEVNDSIGDGTHTIRIQTVDADNDIRISNCFIRTHTNASYYAAGIFINDADAIVKMNNIIIHHRGGTDNSNDCISSKCTKIYLGNITCYGGDRGIRLTTANTNSSAYIRNCLCTNTDEADFYGYTGPTYDWDYNASQDITAYLKGTNNNRINQTFTFTNATNFALTSDDTGAKGYGIDMSSDPYIPYSTDISGISFGSLWDIGACAYSSGGTSLNNLKKIFIIYNRKRR